jgi:hypothetical protein
MQLRLKELRLQFAKLSIKMLLFNLRASDSSITKYGLRSHPDKSSTLG